MNRQKIRRGLKKWFHNLEVDYKRHFLSKDWKQFVEANSKGDKLTEEQKKQIDMVYKKYKPVSYVFHQYYTEKTGDFCADYMPNDFYYNYIDRFYNDWEVATIFDNKCYYSQYFSNVRQPDTVVMRINNIWFDDNRNIVSFNDVQQKLKEEQNIFIKIAADSSGGTGVFYVENEDIVNESTRIIANICEDIIVQRPIHQHEALSRLNSTSVNSIRVISLLTDKEVKIYSSVLRIGTNGSRVDNTSSGGMSCGITDEGKLKKYAYFKSGDRIEKNPDTGLAYLNYEIPGFNKIKEKVCELACQMPRFRLVSWDFAVGTDGEPILIEANLKYGGLGSHQLNNGPIFGEDTEKILKEVFVCKNGDK